MTRYEQVRAALLSGELDDHLDLLLEDIRARQETLAAHDPPTLPEPTKPPTPRSLRLGGAIDVPDFGAGIDAIRAEQRWLTQYKADHDVISFRVADGYAHYELRGDTLHHIPTPSSYQAHPALIKRLTPEELTELLNEARSTRELLKTRAITITDAG